MKIEHRIKFENAEVIYVSVYKNKTIMHHHPKRLISEDRKYDVGCWIKKHKSMINKDFKAINGSVVNVEIFAKRITLTNQDFKYSCSCYIFSEMSDFHKNLISESVLNEIKYYVNNTCIYLKPQEEQGQMSLF